MTRKKLTKLEIATRGGISEEMARPRTAMSARIAELNMKTGRNPERPSTGAPGKDERGRAVKLKKGAPAEITGTS